MAADIKGEIAQRDAVRGSEGAKKYTRMMRDGSLSFADFMLVAELEGLVKIVNSTVTSAGITCGGAYDADTNDFAMNVPVGTTVMIIRAEVTVGALTDDVDTQILFVASNTAFATVGVATVVTPVNKFGGTNGPGTGSNCGCSVAIAGNGGVDSSGGARAYTFWRERQEHGAAPAAAQNEPSVNCRYVWVAPRDGLPAVVAGAGSVVGYVDNSTAAVETHITVEWIEVPTSWLIG